MIRLITLFGDVQDSDFKSECAHYVDIAMQALNATRMLVDITSPRSSLDKISYTYVNFQTEVAVVEMRESQFIQLKHIRR